MSGVKIKICGLFRECDIDYVNEASPDYIGFVFAKSKRQISFEQARKFKQKLAKNILAVGVFVDAEISTIEQAVTEKVIDLIQLHGKEDSSYLAECKKKMPDIPLIKALRIGENIPSNADIILYDAPLAGSGQTFDWSLLPKNNNYILAGGINLNNIDKALEIKPYALDISSGAEKDGFKDKDLIAQLIRRVKHG